MLDTDSTLLVIIDVQEKLASAMHDSSALITNLQKMIRGALLLGIPIIATEQVNLGSTVPDVAGIMDGVRPIEKRSFSCCGEKQFMNALEKAGRRQVMIAGIECHICVYQTAVDLAARGYEVQVLADCVSSRTSMNRSIGLERMNSEGVRSTSAEMSLFELLKVAEGDAIRALSRIVK
ncbi:MAG TPA: hydrolase [Deltaproteobacteria bacterium]|nr:hydrolase [Deltaproteobacteria bacterium]